MNYHYIRWYFFIKKQKKKIILIKYFKTPLILINKYKIKNKKTGIIYKNKVYYMVVSIIYAHENIDFKAIK